MESACFVFPFWDSSHFAHRHIWLSKQKSYGHGDTSLVELVLLLKQKLPLVVVVVKDTADS